MKNLACASKSEQDEFFDAFDDVLCDIDGVVTFMYQKIAGSDVAINNLKQLGKRVVFVSNNSSRGTGIFANILKSLHLLNDPNDLVIPLQAIIDHLKAIQFNKELFVISTQFFKNELIEAGFKLSENMPGRIEESLEVLAKTVKSDKRIGAVIVDFDPNCSFIQLQKAANCLKDSTDVLFICAATDSQVPVGANMVYIGPKNFQLAIEENSDKQPMIFAKPYSQYNNFIKKKYNIKKPSRTLLIGDSVNEDMAFATNCGYKKLLVLSGLTKQEAVDHWKWPVELKPNYYVESLKVIADLLDDRLNKKC